MQHMRGRCVATAGWRSSSLASAGLSRARKRCEAATVRVCCTVRLCIAGDVSPRRDDSVSRKQYENKRDCFDSRSAGTWLCSRNRHVARDIVMRSRQTIAASRNSPNPENPEFMNSVNEPRAHSFRLSLAAVNKTHTHVANLHTFIAQRRAHASKYFGIL
jgi:hypothetical protein